MKSLSLALNLFIVVCLSGCGSKDVKQNAPPADTGPKPAEIKADFDSKAEFLAMEFGTDEVAAGKKYKGKSVTVTGVVLDRVGDPDKLDTTRLILAGVKGDKPLNLRCELAVIDKYTVEQYKKLSAGDTVKVNGKCAKGEVSKEAGKPDELEFLGCKIVEWSRITAGQR